MQVDDLIDGAVADGSEARNDSPVNSNVDGSADSGVGGRIDGNVDGQVDARGDVRVGALADAQLDGRSGDRLGDGQYVSLRCSAVVFRDDAVLLCQRPSGEWVLPGGTPRRGEGTAACVLREVREETGLLVDPRTVAFVLEATNLDHGQHLIEIVFHATPVSVNAEPVGREPGLEPRYVPVAQLGVAALRPPIGGHIRALHTTSGPRDGLYLGNVWRPDPVARTAEPTG